jgi:hypothetical protein
MARVERGMTRPGGRLKSNQGNCDAIQSPWSCHRTMANNTDRSPLKGPVGDIQTLGQAAQSTAITCLNPSGSLLPSVTSPAAGGANAAMALISE